MLIEKQGMNNNIYFEEECKIADSDKPEKMDIEDNSTHRTINNINNEFENIEKKKFISLLQQREQKIHSAPKINIKRLDRNTIKENINKLFNDIIKTESYIKIEKRLKENKKIKQASNKFLPQK